MRIASPATNSRPSAPTVTTPQKQQWERCLKKLDQCGDQRRLAQQGSDAPFEQLGPSQSEPSIDARLQRSKHLIELGFELRKSMINPGFQFSKPAVNLGKPILHAVFQGLQIGLGSDVLVQRLGLSRSGALGLVTIETCSLKFLGQRQRIKWYGVQRICSRNAVRTQCARGQREIKCHGTYPVAA